MNVKLLSSTVRYYPASLRFLGYDPFLPPTTLPERIARDWQKLGLSIEAAAKILCGAARGAIRHEAGTSAWSASRIGASGRTECTERR
jgi:hypothetical protein